MIIKLFLSEIFLSIIVLFQLLHNTNIVRDFVNNSPLLNKEAIIQLYLTIFFTLFLLINSKINGVLFYNLFYCDVNTQSMKIFFLLIVCVITPFIKESLFLQKINFVEFDSLFLFSILSGILLISASDFLLIYVLVEMQSLCFYTLSSLRRNSSYSIEAGIKYFVFGSVVSCLFLLGLGILYLIVGTLNFYDLSILCFYNYSSDLSQLLFLSTYFLSVLFFFKLAIVPFHFWALDVYEGAPLGSTIIFAILTKPILIHLLIKWIFIMGSLFLYVKKLFFILALFSIVTGTFMTLKQRRVKRLIIYSSIAQIGYLVMSLSLNTFISNVYAYFFLFVYILNAIVIWGCLVLFSISKNKIYRFLGQENKSLFISDFKNLFRYNFIFSICFICLFFSIAGIPPFIGFLSKMYVVLGLIQQQKIFLASFIVFISSISIYYYIRIIKIIFFDFSITEFINIKKFQSTFEFDNLFSCFFVLVFGQSLLLLLFFYSDILIIISQYFALTASFL
jgi:proton-translocating NADH-quinone oxidoreductase chain N